MQNDLYSNAKTVIGVSLVAGDTGLVVGEIIDTLGFESGMLTLTVGAYTSGNVTLTEIQESDDSGMSGETAIPAERLIGSIAAITTADTTDSIGFVTTKRYVRATITYADTPVMTGGAVVTLGSPDIGPVVPV